MSKESMTLEQKAARTATLRAQNVDQIHRIQRSTQGSIEFTMARFEHFMLQLVSLGVLTEDQVADINLRWEEDLHEQLAALEENIHLQMENAKRAAREKQLLKPKSSLIVPPGRG